MRMSKEPNASTKARSGAAGSSAGDCDGAGHAEIVASRRSPGSSVP
jgi:hypothetical protein